MNTNDDIIGSDRRRIFNRAVEMATAGDSRTAGAIAHDPGYINSQYMVRDQRTVYSQHVFSYRRGLIFWAGLRWAELNRISR